MRSTHLFPSLLLSTSLLSTSLASGCSGTTEADAGRDAPVLDAPVAIDGGSDAPSTDAPTADVSAIDDAGSDAGGDDAGPGFDGGACEYTALDEVIVLCDGEHTFVSRIGVFPTTDECPEYYVVGGRPTHYESTEQAIDGEDCDDSCEWHFSSAVTRLYCGRRSGYEVLRAEGCPDVYRIDGAYYPTVEAYDETHPCP
jgi:hypothetical protein